MNWIQKHYDRFALIVVAVVLLGSSALLVWQIQAFQASFAPAQEKVPHGTKVAPLDTSVIDRAFAFLKKPATWEGHSGLLFASRKYLVKAGVPVDPTEGGKIHPPVENEWFVTNNLDLLESNILNEDPDADGFTNFEEWTGKTDPNNKDSHPPFIEKLRLVRFIKKPFRLLFPAYDDDSFQINTLDLRQPTQFCKLGDKIGGTKFKIVKFEHKTVPNPKTDGAELDVSELTLQNLETEVQVVLVLNRTVDSPDSYAQFRYLLDNSELQIKKDQKFTLKVEPGVEYKLIDIQESAALITKKSGEQIKVPRLEASPR